MPALQAVGFSHSEQESNDRKQPSVCEFVMPHVMYLTSILLSYSKCLCNEVFVQCQEFKFIAKGADKVLSSLWSKSKT